MSRDSHIYKHLFSTIYSAELEGIEYKHEIMIPPFAIQLRGTRHIYTTALSLK